MLNIPCANLLVGFWKYDKVLNILPNDNVKKEDIPVLENQVPEIDKYCGIFRTLGDKRLRTHLLCGLEKILENIALLCISKGTLTEEQLNNIKKIFPESRLPSKIKTYKTIKLFTSPKGVAFDDWCTKPVYEKEKYDAIISCQKLKDEIKNNKFLNLFLEQSDKYDELFPLLSKGISEKHKNMIRSILDKMIKGQKSERKFFDSLIDIYARIWYEVSRIKKCLQVSHINWGTILIEESTITAMPTRII